MLSFPKSLDRHMFKVNDLKPEWSAKVAANVANVEAKVRAKLKREWKSSGGVDRVTVVGIGDSVSPKPDL